MPLKEYTSPKRRFARIDIKVSDTEKSCIRDGAKLANMTMTDFIVWSCLDSDQVVSVIDSDKLSDIALELARQGNNLNQIAHVANIVKNKPGVDKALLDDIMSMLLRLNESQHAAYASVRDIQKHVYQTSFKRLLFRD